MKFAQICPKQTLKYTYFVNIPKRPKNGQMAEPFFFWQTVFKKAKWQPWSRYRYTRRGLVIGTFPGLIIGTLKCPGQGLVIRTLSVQCTDSEVCTDKFCTDSESDKGGLVIGTVPITRPWCIKLLISANSFSYSTILLKHFPIPNYAASYLFVYICLHVNMCIKAFNLQ